MRTFLYVEATNLEDSDAYSLDIAPGIYLARIHKGRRVETKKLVLVK